MRTPSFSMAQSRCAVRTESTSSACARFYCERGASLAWACEEEFATVIERFKHTQQTLADLSVADFPGSMQFRIGVMVHGMLDSILARRGTNGACDPLGTDESLEATVQFVAAGLGASTKDVALAAQVREPTQAA